MLHDTSRLLSDLTDYAGVVVGAHRPAEATIRSVQLVGAEHRGRAARGRARNGAVEKHTIELPDGVGDERA